MIHFFASNSKVENENETEDARFVSSFSSSEKNTNQQSLVPFECSSSSCDTLKATLPTSKQVGHYTVGTVQMTTTSAFGRTPSSAVNSGSTFNTVFLRKEPAFDVDNYRKDTFGGTTNSTAIGNTKPAFGVESSSSISGTFGGAKHRVFADSQSQSHSNTAFGNTKPAFGVESSSISGIFRGAKHSVFADSQSHSQSQSHSNTAFGNTPKAKSTVFGVESSSISGIFGGAKYIVFADSQSQSHSQSQSLSNTAFGNTKPAFGVESSSISGIFGGSKHSVFADSQSQSQSHSNTAVGNTKPAFGVVENSSISGIFGGAKHSVFADSQSQSHSNTAFGNTPKAMSTSFGSSVCPSIVSRGPIPPNGLSSAITNTTNCSSGYHPMATRAPLSFGVLSKVSSKATTNINNNVTGFSFGSPKAKASLSITESVNETCRDGFSSFGSSAALSASIDTTHKNSVEMFSFGHPKTKVSSPITTTACETASKAKATPKTTDTESKSVIGGFSFGPPKANASSTTTETFSETCREGFPPFGSSVATSATNDTPSKNVVGFTFGFFH